ncbi:MAG: hypothetical protein ACYDH9_04370 [Limisphaerales bacterium]
MKPEYHRHAIAKSTFDGGGTTDTVLNDKQHWPIRHFMITQTQTQHQSGTTERSSSTDTVLGFAVIGCLVAGTVGVLKALSMESGFDVLLCLLGSVAAFGAVFYVYLGKR